MFNMVDNDSLEYDFVGELVVENSINKRENSKLFLSDTSTVTGRKNLNDGFLREGWW